MLENKHEILIHANKSFVGTGHNAELVTDDSGCDWILYHGVSIENPHGRVLLLDKVSWLDGWPYVEHSSPSIKSESPFLLINETVLYYNIVIVNGGQKYLCF